MMYCLEYYLIDIVFNVSYLEAHGIYLPLIGAINFDLLINLVS